MAKILKADLTINEKDADWIRAARDKRNKTRKKDGRKTSNKKRI